MNETVQDILAPLAAFWIALDGMIKMVNFVNGMREAIITGIKDEIALSLNHRNALFFDWKLSMAGFIGAVILFGGIVFSFAELVPKVKIGIYGVSLVILLSAILFILCGMSDYKAIKYALVQDTDETNNA